VRRVHHFEVELGPVELARVVGDHGDRRVGGSRDHAKTGRRLCHPVAVTHPHRIFLTDTPHILEQGAVLGDLYFGTPELAMMTAFDLAAELQGHRLLAVADAENGHAGLVERGRGERSAGFEHGSRAAREDDALRLHRRQGGLCLLVGHDFRIHLLLAHAPRDELGHL
jgi:hypothetical protein